MRPIRAFFVLAVSLGLACTGSPALAKKPPKGKAIHGAIAVNRDTKAVGYAYDFRTAKEAKRAALKQCGDGKCEVLTSFRNGCAAVADGQRKLTAMTGVTRDEAETKAIRKCGADCKILAWACTR